MGETGGVMPQAAPAAPSAPAPQKPKGAIGIWIGVLVIIAGIVLGIVLVVAGAKSLLNGFGDLQRVPINGGGVVRIEEAGTQTIYAERPSTSSGTSFSSGSFNTFAPDVAVRVIGPGESGDVVVNTGGAQETYTYDGRDGVSIGTFYASAPGTYRIVTQLQDGSSWNMIAVGTGLELSGIGAILGGVFGGGLVVLIGIVLVIVFAVRRSRSKKRLQPASPYPSAYNPAGAGWPAAPGYAPPGAPGGYGAPPAPGGYAAPAAGAWAADNPGWAAPPVVHPVDPQQPGPTWNPPQSPPPQGAPAQDTWQPPAPAVPPPWQPGGAATPPPPAEAPADPLAPSWDPPSSSDAPPPPSPPPSSGDSDGSTAP